jgi:hypothetical protein
MQAASRLDAKNPFLRFEDDTEAKARAATDLIRQMADRWIGPVYAELEAIRVRPADATTPSPSDGWRDRGA